MNCDKCERDIYPASIGGLCIDCWSEREASKIANQVFTTAEVAKLCGVAPRTVSKWCDGRRLQCYRIPGSQDRRIPRTYLVKFLRTQGMEEQIRALGEPTP